MISTREAMASTVVDRINENFGLSNILNITTTTASWLEASTILTLNISKYNESVGSIQLEHAPQLSQASVIKVIVLSVMAVISFIGNVATMWNIYKTRLSCRTSRHSWSAIYALIFHLSIADLLVTIFCISGEAIWYYTVEWVAGDFACKLMKIFQMFSLYLSTYVLVLIGVDRWVAVKYPMKSLHRRCYRLLGGVYVLSFLLSLPQFFIFRVAKGPFIEEFYQCVTHGFYTHAWQEQLYNTFTLFFTFIIPLCILFVTYLSTFRTISNSEKMFQGYKEAESSNKPSVRTNRQRLIHKAKMKSLRISIVIICAFLVCWTPYNFMMIIFTFLNPNKRFGEDLQSGIFFFGMSNSLVNPLIYGAFHLRPIQRKNNKQNAYSLTRGDSQRSPSLMTAVTQIDYNGRQAKSFRHASFHRANNGTITTAREHATLLNNGNTTTANAFESVPQTHKNFSKFLQNTNLNHKHERNCQNQSHQLPIHPQEQQNFRNGLHRPKSLILKYNNKNMGNDATNIKPCAKLIATTLLEANDGVSSV